MGRYLKDVELNQPIDVVSLVMEDYIYHNHFTRTDWNGEMVFYLKDSHGGERYLKWSYAGGIYHVEAWLRGPFGNEMDLDGVGGGASRREFRESMDRLVEQLRRQRASDLAGGHVGADPLHHDTDYQVEHRAWKEAEKQSAMPHQGPLGADKEYFSQRMDVLLGTIGIIFGSVFPIVGIIIGIRCVRKYQGTGRILGIIAIALSIVRLSMTIISFLYPVMLL